MEYELDNSFQSDCIVFSLKASSILLQKLKNYEGILEFDENKNAKVSLDGETFSLQHYDCNPTDAYSSYDSSKRLKLLGSSVDRFRVVTSVDNEKGFKKSSAVPKKKSIAMVAAENLELQNKKGKTELPQLTSPSKPQITSHVTPVAITKAKAPTVSHTIPWITIESISCDVTIKDILTFFSGLSVERCVVGLQGTNSLVVNIYVEFKSTSGSEVAILRNGESIKYNVKSNVSSSSSVKDIQKSHIVSLKILQDEQLFWVQGVGLLVYDARIEMKQQSLSSSVQSKIYEFKGSLSENCSCLSMEPLALTKQWHFILKNLPQLYLSRKSNTVTSAIRKTKVPNTFDSCYGNSSYLFNNISVEDIFDDHIGLSEPMNTPSSELHPLQLELLKASPGLPTANAKTLSALEKVSKLLLELSSLHDSLIIKSYSLLSDGVHTSEFPSKLQLTYAISHVGRVCQALKVVRAELWRISHID